MSKTKIIYRDIAPGASDDASISSSDAQISSNLSLLPDGIEPLPSVTLEKSYWLLDGTRRFHATQQTAFWSTQMSDSEGRFTEYPEITMDFDEQYSSVGITLFFDRATGEYCSEVQVKWYQGDTLKGSGVFHPKSERFFCQKNVASYNRVVITIMKTSLPFRYAKMEKIVFGVDRYFEMSDLRSASIINELNLISAEIPISTMRWTLDSREDVDYMFQLKQPVEVYNDENLICIYYIDSYSRKAKSIYDISCYDAFGVLNENPFDGGIYSNQSAKELLNTIIGEAFPITYSDDAVDMQLTGAILPCSKREAVQQVLFAWGCVAATDGSKGIRVFKLQNTEKLIDTNRTYIGVSVNTASVVTEVRVSAHTYTQNTNGNVTIGGTKYSDTETVYTVRNPNVTATDKQNVVEIKGATLVSTSIGQATAQRIYDYYMKRNTNNAKIVWKGERLGDYMTLSNAWGSSNTGHTSRMEIRLSNTVAATCSTVGN